MPVCAGAAAIGLAALEKGLPEGAMGISSV